MAKYTKAQVKQARRFLTRKASKLTPHGFENVPDKQKKYFTRRYVWANRILKSVNKEK